MLDVPLVKFVRKLLTESPDVSFHLGSVGIFVERVYYIFVAKRCQAPEITVFFGQFESPRRKPIFVSNFLFRSRVILIFERNSLNVFRISGRSCWN